MNFELKKECVRTVEHLVETKHFVVYYVCIIRVTRTGDIHIVEPCKSVG